MKQPIDPYERPKPKTTVPVSYRLPTELANEITRICHTYGISRSDLLREIAEVGLPVLLEKRGWS